MVLKCQGSFSSLISQQYQNLLIMKDYFSSVFYIFIYIGVSLLLLVDPNVTNFNTISVGLFFSYMLGFIVGNKYDLLGGKKLGSKAVILFFALGPVFYFLFFTILHPSMILENPLTVSLGLSFGGYFASNAKNNWKALVSVLVLGLIFIYSYLGLYW